MHENGRHNRRESGSDTKAKELQKELHYVSEQIDEMINV